jgi:hypothetical protein
MLMMLLLLLLPLLLLLLLLLLLQPCKHRMILYQHGLPPSWWFCHSVTWMVLLILGYRMGGWSRAATAGSILVELCCK